MTRRNWTRDELIVAFNLYCRTPFGRIHNRNPEIIRTAEAIGRSPSALSWKLANFSRFDPSVTGRKLVGATHGSSLDQEIWAEFNEDWDRLAFESEKLRARFFGLDLEKVEPSSDHFPEGRTRPSSVVVRVNQGFFRSMILAAYDGRCCLTGLAIPELLTASHIIPWSVDERNRTNPRNGLCLNALHDKAFDRGLISVDEEFRILVSPKVKRENTGSPSELLLQYEGDKIQMPHHFLPDPTFLAFHRDTIYRRR
jgi:putative restriction endonuclease